MTIMVIGGSGFIGSHVVKALTNDRVEVISYDLIQSNVEDNKSIRADILELPSIERVLFEYQVDTIIHLVGLPAMEYCEKNPHFSFLLNVMSVQNALEAIRVADIKRIIFASSAAVYGSACDKPLKETDFTNPKTIYGHHKLIAEQAIKAYAESYGINYIILRLFNVYGGDPHLGKDVISIFIRRALNGEPLVVKGPNKFRDFIHIDDVAYAFLRASKENHNNIILNIGTGEKITLKQLAKIVKTYFPNIEIIEQKVPDDGTGLQADINSAQNLLQFKPKSPAEGISAYIAKYAKR